MRVEGEDYEPGIIPAYAGSTVLHDERGTRGQDHPRIRGEHRRAGQPGALDCGSSPHTRGALGVVGNLLSGNRIIPAYAGSTSRRRYPARACQDHPRIRGEHFIKYGIVPSSEGSSPHTRGAPIERVRDVPRWGIIPAYAGSTTSGATKAKKLRDHPRIRGEHERNPREIYSRGGSSPHTRGARLSQLHHLVWTGIIPAYAGSTFDSEFLCGPGTDHPRIRGEHVAPRVSAPGVKGSSPHTRGAPQPHQAGNAE